jgi:hypothetical protein
MLTIAPTQASYQIGDTVTVADPANDLFANPGDSVHLLMFGDDYSDVLDTTTTDEGGIATFPNFIIPDFPIGTPRFVVMRHGVSMGEVFSEQFELLPASSRPSQHHRLSLGLGLGL